MIWGAGLYFSSVRAEPELPERGICHLQVPRSWELLPFSVGRSQEMKLLQSLWCWWCNDVIFLNCSRLQLRKLRIFLALPFLGVFPCCCTNVPWDLSRRVLPPHLPSAHSDLLLWGFCITEQPQLLLFHMAPTEFLTPVLLLG